MSSTTERPERAEEAHNEGPPKKTAFISAPHGVDTRTIRRVLDSLGFSSLTAYEAALPGRNIREIIVDCIKQADVSVAVRK
jgi:hypothetical protein